MRDEDLVSWSERIAEQAAQLDAATHRLLTDLREFEAAGGPGSAGVRTAAEWLSWRVGWDLATAREHMRVARALGGLPQLDDALRRGEISYSKLRAITRIATPDIEELLLTYARKMTASQLEKTCRKFAAVKKLDDKARPADLAHDRFVRRRELDDGRVSFHVVLPPDEAAMFSTMLDHQAKRLADVSAETPPAESLVAARRIDRADALMALVHEVLRGEHPDRAPVEVVISVPAAGLQKAVPDPLACAGCSAHGDPIPAETARRLACDAGIVEMTVDDHGNPLSMGRKTRVLSAAILRALAVRDPMCRFPGCANRLYLHGHHIEHWADGGATEIGNLIHLCSHHHRFVHELGYSITRRDDGGFAFADPHGRPVLEVFDRPAMSSALAWERIRHANAALGIDGETAAHGWDGQPINYPAAVNSLNGELNIVAICPWSDEDGADDDDDYVYPENYDHVGLIEDLLVDEDAEDVSAETSA